MNARCRIDGCDRYAKGRGLCNSHYSTWWRTVGPQSEDGPGICACPVSYPAPKCCTVCGYPSVHRMAPHIRAKALAKMPQLADQLVLGLEAGAA